MAPYMVIKYDVVLDSIDFACAVQGSEGEAY